MSSAMQPMYSGAAALPLCGEFYSFVKQGAADGGPSVGEGIAQSGAAFTARAAFRASLLSYVTDTLGTAAPSAQNYALSSYLGSPAPAGGFVLPLWSGIGALTVFGAYGSNLRLSQASGNGRYNTSENATGNWLDSTRPFEIALSTPHTAFGFNMMDLGDFNAEVEVEFFLSGVKTRALILPVLAANKPLSDFMNVSYADGNLPFDRVLINITHPIGRPPNDAVGFDDFDVGHVVSCVPSTSFIVHHAENTEAVAAKTVAGPALDAYTAWVSGAPNLSFSDFSALSLGVSAMPQTVVFTGPLSAKIATVTAIAYDYLRAQSVGSTTVDNSGSSQRWGASGGKWLEFEDELHISFSSSVTEIGFYLTDLGDQNATVRISLTDAAGSGVVHYLPKASQLAAPAGRLRFWGVRGELAFTKVIIRPMYYTNLDPYSNAVDTGVTPAIWSVDTGVTKDVIGIHSIFIGE